MSLDENGWLRLIDKIRRLATRDEHSLPEFKGLKHLLCQNVLPRQHLLYWIVLPSQRLQNPQNCLQVRRFAGAHLISLERLHAQQSPRLRSISSSEAPTGLGGQFCGNAPHHDLEFLPPLEGVKRKRPVCEFDSKASSICAR